MKHIKIQEILQRRGVSKPQQIDTPQQSHSFSRCVNRQFRQINDQTIDSLIKIAKRNDHLTSDHRLDLLQIIAAKTGVHLNKNIMGNYITLIFLPNVTQLQQKWQKQKKNYFILKGSIQIYQQTQKGQGKFNTQPVIKNRKSSLDDEELKYQSLEEFRKFNTDYDLLQQVQEFRGIGKLFGIQRYLHSDQQPHNHKLISVNAVLVILEDAPLEQEQVINDGMAYEDKLEILNYFPVLKVMGKKLSSFINNFKVKQYSLKQLIYKKGEKPKSMYFLIRGQVNFELVIEDLEQNDGSAPFILSTQSLQQKSYFGEEEIIFKAQRNQSAKAGSANCVVLELDKDKFDKMMENHQFNQLVTRAAQIKRAQRLRKIDRARDILQKKVFGGPKIQGLNQMQAKILTVNTERNDTRRRFSLRRPNQANVKLMHGHVLKQSPPTTQPVNFSMLEVNPDMYEAAKKKFRKYNVKPLQYQPRGRWDFKKVWKILNLEDVLQQEEIDISAPEGRKFYDCHRRYQQQLKDSHSLRPKTTSSNYRTKLQYIAYLQQFNH